MYEDIKALWSKPKVESYEFGRACIWWTCRSVEYPMTYEDCFDEYAMLCMASV